LESASRCRLTTGAGSSWGTRATRVRFWTLIAACTIYRRSQPRTSTVGTDYGSSRSTTPGPDPWQRRRRLTPPGSRRLWRASFRELPGNLPNYRGVHGERRTTLAERPIRSIGSASAPRYTPPGPSRTCCEKCQPLWAPKSQATSSPEDCSVASDRIGPDSSIGLLRRVLEQDLHTTSSGHDVVELACAARRSVSTVVARSES
jgi:hypothetical protein